MTTMPITSEDDRPVIEDAVDKADDSGRVVAARDNDAAINATGGDGLNAVAEDCDDGRRANRRGWQSSHRPR